MGVRVNAVQAERWTKSKSLRGLSLSLVPPLHRKGGYWLSRLQRLGDVTYKNILHKL